MIINCLNKSLDFIVQREHRYSSVLEITTNKIVIIVKYNEYFQLINKGVKLYNKHDLIKILFKNIICTMKIYNKSKFFITYCYKNKYATIIQRGYRRYRIRTARIRNDLVIHGLTELWFHPLKLTFEC